MRLWRKDLYQQNGDHLELNDYVTWYATRDGEHQYIGFLNDNCPEENSYIEVSGDLANANLLLPNLSEREWPSTWLSPQSILDWEEILSDLKLSIIGKPIKGWNWKPNMKYIKDMTEPELRDLMNIIAIQIVNATVGVEKPKFALLLFNDPALAQYVCNCNRQDVIKAMRECADRLERNEDLPR